MSVSLCPVPCTLLLILEWNDCCSWGCYLRDLFIHVKVIEDEGSLCNHCAILLACMRKVGVCQRGHRKKALHGYCWNALPAPLHKEEVISVCVLKYNNVEVTRVKVLLFCLFHV